MACLRQFLVQLRLLAQMISAVHTYHLKPVARAQPAKPAMTHLAIRIGFIYATSPVAK